MSVPASWYLLLAFSLFSIGALGALLRRHPLERLLAVQLMLVSSVLAGLVQARLPGASDAALLALFTTVVAVAQVTIGVALTFRRSPERAAGAPGAAADDRPATAAQSSSRPAALDAPALRLGHPLRLLAVGLGLVADLLRLLFPAQLPGQLVWTWLCWMALFLWAVLG